MQKAYIPFTFLLLIAACNAFSQTQTEKQLALQYFQAQEYDKAVVLYERFFNRSGLTYYYNYYLNCLLKLNEHKTAEKLVKKQIKKNPDPQIFIVDLGYVYTNAGEIEKAKQQYERAVKEVPADRPRIIELANAFLTKNVTDYAINTYLKGRKILKGSYLFHLEIANVYSRAGKFNMMIQEYLDLLLEDPSYLHQVQNILQYRVFEDQGNKNAGKLNNFLLIRIQKHPGKHVFSEMLIWYYLQKKNFESAFTFAKALDKRLKEDGKRIMDLAKLSTSSAYYDVAISCYKYVCDKGRGSPYYINSRIEMMDVINTKIISSSYTMQDLLDLEKNYLLTIDELGKTTRIIPLLRGQAHLQAFYLHNTDEAISILEETILMPRIRPKDKAACKIELADILLLVGDVWEASLYYSQVEKAFKHDPIGHDAKFKNARLYFYKGEFKWSQAQLDVLKASTSKLIANDAMDLSLLISDNTALDTTTEALFTYAAADLLSFQNKDSAAIEKLDSILIAFPGHSLTDEIYYRKSEIYLKGKIYKKAAVQLQLIIDYHLGDILGDNAIYKLAYMNEIYFKDKEKAMELYQDLMVTFPGSLFVVEARKKFRMLRGDKIN